MSLSGWSQRGLILFAQHRYADAEGYFRKSLAEEPNDAHSLYLVALCQINRGQPLPLALETIDSAISLDPSSASYHALRALILGYLRRHPEALRASAAALELDPSSDYVFALRAELMIFKGDWPKAEKAARSALQINPENNEASNLLILALRQQYRLSESVQLTHDLLSVEPDDARNQETAGWVALQNSHFEEASRHFTEALRINPNRASARDGLKRTHKSKIPLYPFYLKYYFFRKPLNLTNILVLAAVLLPLAWISTNDRLSVILVAFFFAPLLFPTARLVLSPLLNFTIWLDPAGKHLLSSQDKWATWLSGVPSLIGFSALAAISFTRSNIHLYVPIALLAASYCFAFGFHENEPRRSKILARTAGTIILAYILVMLLATH